MKMKHKRLMPAAGVAAIALFLSACAGGAGAAESAPPVNEVAVAAPAEPDEADESDTDDEAEAEEPETTADYEPAEDDEYEAGEYDEESEPAPTVSEPVVIGESYAIGDGFYVTPIEFLTIFENGIGERPDWLWHVDMSPEHSARLNDAVSPFERSAQTLDLTLWPSRFLDAGFFWPIGRFTFLDSDNNFDPENGLLTAPRLSGTLSEIATDDAEGIPLDEREITVEPIDFDVTFHPGTHRRYFAQINDESIVIQMYADVPVTIESVSIGEWSDDMLEIRFAQDSTGQSGQFAFRITNADPAVVANLRFVTFEANSEIFPGFTYNGELWARDWTWATSFPLTRWDPMLSELPEFFEQLRATATDLPDHIRNHPSLARD